MSHDEPSTGVTPPATTDAPPALAAMNTCANCSAPLHGAYCHACGQPEKGMIRHLASVLSDVADTVFNIDSRVFRSLPPLYFRPGFLTLEYFAGRRTRYVTPFRLFFFFCIISFLAIQWTLNISKEFVLFDAGNDGQIDQATTPTEVQQRLQVAVDRIDKTQNKPSVPAKVRTNLDKVKEDVRTKAAQRLLYLKSRQDALANGTQPPPDPHDDIREIFAGRPWDPSAHPFHIGWLPDFANARLTAMAVHVKENLLTARRDPGHAIAGLFSVLPQTLFVLMPLFAVLLKITYVFKRRLYMEHLIVALHSHAFIFLSLLLLVIMHLLLGWAQVHAQWLSPLLQLLRAATWVWLPVYLFLMQKRVYRQGWAMTTLKYCFVGWCYVYVLALGVAGAAFISLAIT